MSPLNPARVAREFPSRFRLEAARCEKCGAVTFPPRLVCPSCRGRKFATVPLEPEGKVLTWTVIHVGPSSHKHEVPYASRWSSLWMACATCQIADLDPAQVVAGMPVRLEFRRIQEDGEAGVIAYGHKAVPA
jgi:uncharacterized OB-fold protein